MSRIVLHVPVGAVVNPETLRQVRATAGAFPGPRVLHIAVAGSLLETEVRVDGSEGWVATMGLVVPEDWRLECPPPAPAARRGPPPPRRPPAATRV